METASPIETERCQAPVIGRDGGFVYLAKPAGLPVFPHRDRPGEPCLLALLLAGEPAQAEPGWPAGFDGGILHRLDTRTSGLVIAARSLDALAAGRRAFEDHRLVKRYRFLAARDVPWDGTEVARPLAHDPRRRSRMVWQRGASTPHRGRWMDAVTRFRRLGRPGGARLWEATMGTGVMHQVRVHAASVGLPLAGDRIYGGGGDGRFWLHHMGIDGWPGSAPCVDLPADWPVERGG